MASPTQKGWGSLLEDPIPGDVVKCLEELGIEVLKVENDEATGRCPAHFRLTGKEDRHPSWSVNTESGQHNCFSCGFRGPFVLIVQEAEGLSPDAAVAWVKARGSIDRAKKILTGGGVYVNELSEVEPITEADLALYVEVPTWACDDRWLDPESCDFYGVLWDEKKERWITPIRDPDTGRLWGWQEKGHRDRYFNNFPKDGVKKSKTLFGIQQLEGEEAILVESPLDVVRIHSAGIAGAVSSFGARVSASQLYVLRQAGVKRLISALDNDRDGNKANEDLRQGARGMRLRFWNYGDLEAKDPGDMDDEEIREAYATAYSSVLWKRS